jgi:hypothetical protein
MVKYKIMPTRLINILVKFPSLCQAGKLKLHHMWVTDRYRIGSKLFLNLGQYFLNVLTYTGPVATLPTIPVLRPIILLAVSNGTTSVASNAVNTAGAAGPVKEAITKITVCAIR